ncbi:hypothetical protein GDO81_024579 [Engystomops pustulosus]|uniref:Uncharacterized protein n=1 Tax=Engystomops pustulosus TaxID=76066 RepID=A0AAV6YUE2_ENGPU|nr:hypothetical protein GDO81_024579 [Engystomops pustulosus]
MTTVASFHGNAAFLEPLLGKWSLFVREKILATAAAAPLRRGQLVQQSVMRDLGTKRIQIMLLRSLLMVTSGYKAKTIAAALPPPFLDPLLSPSLMEDTELRQLVLEILHNLIDRHDNRAKLRGIRYLPVQSHM